MIEVISIVFLMTRDRYCQIRSKLKIVVDADIPENNQKEEKLFKIHLINDRIRKGCSSLPKSQEVDE